MRRLALIVPALLATGLAASRADAQINTTPTGQTTTPTGTGVQGAPYGNNIEEVRIGDKGGDKVEKEANPTRVFINRDECAQYFDFELTNVQPRAQTMELWVSRDGTDCSTAAARSITVAGATLQCWFVATKTNVVGKNQKFEDISGKAIFNYAGQNKDAPEQRASCESENANDSPYYLWFVPLSQPTNFGATSQTAPSALPYKIRFNLFTTSPGAPSGVEVRGGETAVTANWDSPADFNIGYRAYFARVASDAVCGVGTLANAEGAPLLGSEVPVDGVNVFRSGKVNGSKATLKSLQDKGIVTGTKVAVAVGTEDIAGNVGRLSAPQCVDVVPTISVLDACSESGTPEDCGLETCGLSSASRGSWFGLSLFVLALSALIRRRTA